MPRAPQARIAEDNLAAHGSFHKEQPANFWRYSGLPDVRFNTVANATGGSNLSYTTELSMAATLASARDEFMRHMYRDNVVAERPRLLAVLDAVIAWSAQHPDQVRFRSDDNSKGVIRFEQVTTHSVFWAASPRRQNVPLLQLLPGASRLLSDDEVSDAVTRLNACTREDNPLGRMQIGFGALKNPGGRAAVFELIDELLEKVQPAVRPEANVP